MNSFVKKTQDGMAVIRKIMNGDKPELEIDFLCYGNNNKIEEVKNEKGNDKDGNTEEVISKDKV